jgi:hypothetical protein
MKRIVHWMALVATSLLVACGGGGGDAGDSPFGGGGSGGGGSATVSDLLISLDKTSITNSGSDSVAVTVIAVDGSRNTLSAVPVSISVDNNAVVSGASATTGTDGKVSATVTQGADRTNRTVTVSASSGSIVRTAAFSVTGAQLAATLAKPVVNPGEASTISFRLTDVNGGAIGGQAVTISLAGSSTTATMDALGVYSYSFNAPSSAGTYPVVASAGGASLATGAAAPTLTVQSAGGSGVPPVTAGVIKSFSVSVNPSVVSVNAVGSRANSVGLRALALGDNNTPIPNVRVRFDLGGDPNSIGGTFDTAGTDGAGAAASTILYANASGVATGNYIPGTRSSPTDGVTIRACYWLDDTVISAPATAPVGCASATLTVVSEPLAVSIGTNDAIESGSSGLTYIRRFVVTVVDARGGAKADVEIVPSLDIDVFAKGFYSRPANSSAWVRTAVEGCPNEDANRNGVNENGEDSDGDGVLDPRKSDIVISAVGPTRTGANGTAVLQVEYPQNVATWAHFRILVSAVGISGTEGRATWTEWTSAPAAAFTATSTPAFYLSPYGIATTAPASYPVTPVAGVPAACYNPR